MHLLVHPVRTRDDGTDRRGTVHIPAVAKLPVVRAAPALHAAVVHGRASVELAAGNEGRRVRQPDDVDRPVPVVQGAVPDLALAVIDPAFQHPAARERAGVPAVETRARQVHDIRRRGRAPGRSVAQLALGVVSQHFTAPVSIERAAVAASERDGGHAGVQAVDVHGPQPVRGRPVAHLPVLVQPPAFQGPRVH